MDAFTVSYGIIHDKSKGIYYTFIQSFFCAIDLILKASGSVLKPRIFRIVILDLEQLDFPQEELHFESDWIAYLRFELEVTKLVKINR